MATRRIEYLNAAGLVVSVDAPDAISTTSPWSSVSLGGGLYKVRSLEQDPNQPSHILEVFRVWGETAVAGVVKAYSDRSPLITSSGPRQLFIRLSAGDAQTGTVGAALASPIVAIVIDSSGAAVSGELVAWAPLDDTDGTTDVASSSSGADGKVSATWTLGQQAGGQTMTARLVSTGEVLQLTATANPGTPAVLSFVSVQDQTAIVATQVAVKPRVALSDAFGNRCGAGITVTFAVVLGGGSGTTLTPTTDVNGEAEVGSWTLGAAPGANSMTAAATGATTITFTASGTTPSLPITLTKQSGDNQTVVAGAAQALVVKLAAGATAIQGGRCVATIIAGGGSLLATEVFTDVNGLSSFSLTTGPQAGLDNQIEVRAFDNNGDQLGVTRTFTTHTTAGTASKMRFVQAPPASAITGVAFPVSVQLLDANDNVVTTPQASIALAKLSGSGSLTTTTPQTTVSGIATFSVTPTGTNGQTLVLRASGSGLTNLDSSTVTITTTTQVPDHLGWITMPQTVASGAIMAAFEVGVYDASNQLVVNGTQPVVTCPLETPAGATIVGNSVQAVNGTARFTACVITAP